MAQTLQGRPVRVYFYTLPFDHESRKCLARVEDRGRESDASERLLGALQAIVSIESYYGGSACCSQTVTMVAALGTGFARRTLCANTYIIAHCALLPTLCAATYTGWHRAC